MYDDDDPDVVLRGVLLHAGILNVFKGLLSTRPCNYCETPARHTIIRAQPSTFFEHLRT